MIAVPTLRTMLESMPLYAQGLVDFGIAMIFAILAACFGYTILRVIDRANSVRINVIYCFALGGALISWLLLVAACIQHLNAWTIGGVVAIQCFAILIQGKSFLRQARLQIKAAREEFRSQWQSSDAKLGIAFVLGCILLTLLSAITTSFAPSIEADSSTTYFNAAKLFLLYNGIIDVGNIVGNMAKQGFMPLAYGISLSSTVFAQLWLLLFAIGAMIHMGIAFSRSIGLLSASLATLILVTMRHHIDYTYGIGKIDGLTLAYSIWALLSWLAYVATPSRALIVINAVAVGFLVGLSYANGLAGLVFFVFLATIELKNNSLQTAVKSVAIWSLLAFLVAAPSYIFNWIEFRNPLYPYFSDVFKHGLGYDLLGKQGTFYDYFSELLKDQKAQSIRQALTLPLQLWNTGDLLQSREERGFMMFWILASVGMVWILLRPDAKSPRFISVCLLLGYVGLYISWAFNQCILRYFTLAFPIIYWFGSHAVERISTRLQTRYVSSAALICCAVLMTNISLKTVRYMVKYPTLETYIAKRFVYSPTDQGEDMLPFGKSIIEIREMLKPKDKVLSFITGHAYLGDEVIVFSGNGTLSMPSSNGLQRPLYMYRTAAELLADLRASGFTAIIIHPRFLYLSDGEKPPIQDLLTRYKPAHDAHGVLVYEVNG